MPWDFGVSDVLNLPTSNTDTSKVLAPDGAGGLQWVTASAGVTDHGALTGLGDDDHAQYHTDARALTWHSALSGAHVANGNDHDHIGGDGAQIAHGSLSGLSGDDHTGYLLATGTRTGATGEFQVLTLGLRTPKITPIQSGGGIIFRNYEDTQSWLTVRSTELTVHQNNYLLGVARNFAIKTDVSEVWSSGPFIRNSTGAAILSINPVNRRVGVNSTLGEDASLTVSSPNNQRVLGIYAYSGQTEDVIRVGDKNGSIAYQLTYDNIHTFLGNVKIAGRASSAPAFDRLQGANQRYTITFTNCSASNADVLFSGLHSGAPMTCDTGVEGTVEIDFNPFVSWTANTATGFTYTVGTVVCSFFSGRPASTVWLDLYYLNGGGAGIDGWQTNMGGVQNNLSQTIHFTVPSLAYLKKIRLRFSHTSHPVWVNGISYFPDTPEDIAEMTVFPRFASERVKVGNKGIDYYDSSWVVRHSMDYQVADGASAVAYMHDTKNALSTGGAKLATWKNNGTLKMSIDKDGQLVPVGGILLSGTNLVTDTTTGAKLATSSAQKLGAWGAPPVVRPSAYTQTYSTADKTLSAYTSDPESSAYTGIDNAQGGTPYAQLADLNALRTAYENLRTFTEDTAQMLNSVVDDLQTIGWLA